MEGLVGDELASRLPTLRHWLLCGMTGEWWPVELVRAHLNRDGRAKNDSGLLELVAKVQPRAGAIHPEALPPEARPTLNSCGRLVVDTQHNWQVGRVLVRRFARDALGGSQDGLRASWAQC